MSSRSLEDDVELPWQRKSRVASSNTSNFFKGYEEKEKARPFRPSSVTPSHPSIPSSVAPSRPSTPSTSVHSSTSSSTLTVGTHIVHNRFGRGEVLRLDGTGDNTKATVQFENVGTKQLLLKFAKFEVID